MRVPVGVALLLFVVALAAVNYFRPIPAATASTALRPSEVIPGSPPQLPWPSRGEAAVGVQGLGLLASSGTEQAIPAASVTKVMAALIVLEDSKLQLDQTGPVLTMSDTDVQSYQNDLKGQQSVVPVEVGEQLTLLQVLEGMLIPSANNLAETAARWDAGSVDAFVTKMNNRASALHLAHTKFGDVSGASPASVSTPSDLVSLGIVAMQNPVFARIVAMGQVDLPVAGTRYNVDAALGRDGIIGMKTGSGLNTGANFLFAANVTADGHTIVVYGCVMGQATLDAAFASSRQLIRSMSSALHVKRVIERHQTVGTFTTAWGEQSDIVSLFDVDLVEWPGMVLRQQMVVKPLTVEQPLPSGTRTGAVHLMLGDYDVQVALATGNPLYPPGRLWRLTRVAF
jgi:serine-type D-Ala-D-Ala carboxypeptidase (penicillin-binding protein 5/6)